MIEKYLKGKLSPESEEQAKVIQAKRIMYGDQER